MAETPRKPGKQPQPTVRRAQGGRPPNDLSKLLTTTDVREIAVLCVTVSELIRRVFGSYKELQTTAQAHNKKVGGALQKKLSGAKLPDLHEIEAVVECCMLTNSDLLDDTVLPGLRQLHREAVRARDAKKNGTAETSAADVATISDSPIASILLTTNQQLAESNNRLTAEIKRIREGERGGDLHVPERPIVESTVVPDDEATVLVDSDTLQRLRALARQDAGGRVPWDLRLVSLLVLLAVAVGALAWLGWPIWLVVLLALAAFSWRAHHVMTTLRLRHLASNPSGAAPRSRRMVWWLPEEERCLTVLGTRPANRWDTTLHGLIHGDAQSAAEQFTGQLSVARVAGLHPRGHHFSTNVRWELIDLDHGHILNSGTLWPSSRGRPRTTKIVTSAPRSGLVGLTLRTGCPNKITLRNSRLTTVISYPEWWKSAVTNHAHHLHRRLGQRRTAEVDRRRPDLPPAAERQYSSELQALRRRSLAIQASRSGATPARRSRWWRRS